MHVSNIYSNPFQPTCSNCNLGIENFGTIQGTMHHCAKCSAETPVNYLHRLNCTIINTSNAKVPCTLRGDILAKLLPDLIALSYQDYLKNKSTVIYMLRDFFFDGKFILNHENTIVDVKT